MKGHIKKIGDVRENDKHAANLVNIENAVQVANNARKAGGLWHLQLPDKSKFGLINSSFGTAAVPYEYW